MKRIQKHFTKLKKDYTEYIVQIERGTVEHWILKSEILEYLSHTRMALRNKTIVLSIEVLDNVNGYFIIIIIIISITKNSKTKYTECFKSPHPIPNRYISTTVYHRLMNNVLMERLNHQVYFKLSS